MFLEIAGILSIVFSEKNSFNRKLFSVSKQELITKDTITLLKVEP